MNPTQLQHAIADLAAIEAAGLLPGLQLDCAAERKGWPRNDLDRFPLRAPYVKRIASQAAQLFSLPVSDCEAAAAVALLPDCRERQVLDAIARYKARLAVAAAAEP